MYPIRLAALLVVFLAGFALPGHAANAGSAECLPGVADLASGTTYTNVCRSLIHVGKCTSGRLGDGSWSCEYAMYSPGDSFHIADDQRVKIRACRAEFGNCVRAVRCLPTSEPANEKAVVAAAKKCGIDF